MVVPAEKEPQSARGYFELFQLEPCFDLDVEVLGQRFRTLQREFHPDRYAGRPASEQRVAAQLSADINAAFDALRDPVRRAGYLLERQGLDLTELERTPVAGDFLIRHPEVSATVFLEHVPLFEAAFVQQQVDSLPCGELAFLMLFGDPVFAATQFGRGAFLLELLDDVLHGHSTVARHQ